MTHTEILEKLLLFLDRDLPEKEMEHIRGHLSTCPACTKEYEALATLWRPANRPERLKPNPFLWTRLQAQIVEYERSPEIVWSAKVLYRSMMARPLPVLGVLGAIVVGVYLGSPREHQQYEGKPSVSGVVRGADGLGLEQFDAIPPGSFGGTFVELSQADLKSHQPPEERN